ANHCLIFDPLIGEDSFDFNQSISHQPFPEKRQSLSLQLWPIDSNCDDWHSQLRSHIASMCYYYLSPSLSHLALLPLEIANFPSHHQAARHLDVKRAHFPSGIGVCACV